MGVDTIWFAAYFVYACLDGIASKKVKHYLQLPNHIFDGTPKYWSILFDLTQFKQ